jgi:hypothetical protein
MPQAALLLRRERAHKFELDPPAQVRDLLQRLPPDHKMQQNLWHGRI